jgi:hypothetical protein
MDGKDKKDKRWHLQDSAEILISEIINHTQNHPAGVGESQ